ncbi:hypothetical protein EGJ89_07490 [Stenotrophomonas maltophilia]|nr:hypothetical protein EGJ89_07490 [Stenotrophomonas maltophilia]
MAQAYKAQRDAEQGPQAPAAQPPITDLPAVQAVAPDGWEYGMGRDAAFGLRSILQGGGSLLGALGGDALGALETKLTGRPVASFRDNAARLADVLGLPQAQTAGDRVLGDVGEALTGTALTLGGGAALNAGRAVAPTLTTAAPAPTAVPGVAERAGEFLTAQPVLQAISSGAGSAASATARESGAGEGTQLLAALAGGLAPSAISAGTPMALRGAFRGGEANRVALTEALDDFAALGATPSVGQGTGSWLRQGAETTLGGFPTSGSVMARFGQQQGEGIAKGLDQVSRQLSRNPTSEGAGRSIARGVKEFTADVRDRRSLLYDKLDQYVPADAPVPLSRTQQALQKLTTPTPGAEATTGAMVHPELKTLAENIAQDLASAPGGLPYEAVKDVRTKIGNQAFTFDLSPDKPTAQLRQIYHELTQDMEDVAKQAGPEAERALERANRFYAASHKRLELLENVVQKEDGPESVFQAAMSGTREGASKLRSVMRSLPVESQKDVTGAVIRRMGIANPSAQDNDGQIFSAATFLTRWNTLSPEARDTLFGRYGGNITKDLNKIASVANRIKEGSGVLRNPSGSVAGGIAAGYWGSLGLAILGMNIPAIAKLAATGAGANAMARVMTNPKAVRWLAKATDLPIGALPAQLPALQRIAAEDNDSDVAALSDALLEAQQSGEIEEDGNDQNRQSDDRHPSDSDQGVMP